MGNTHFIWVLVVAFAALASATVSFPLNESATSWAGVYTLGSLIGFVFIAWYAPLDNLRKTVRQLWAGVLFGAIYVFFSGATVASFASVDPGIEIAFSSYGAAFGIIIAIFWAAVFTSGVGLVRSWGDLGGPPGEDQTPEERVIGDDLNL